ncbi:MAG: hypothetical protein NVSMB26_20850 [Beijerinckiaceae bacterium]
MRYDAANLEHHGSAMGLKLRNFAALAAVTLLLAGCDRCGDPVRVNIPGEPKSCYETAPQK